MRIAYLGYDILTACLEMIREQQHEIVKIFTIPGGDFYDRNEEIFAFGEKYAVPVTTAPIGEQDIEELIGEGCELLISAGYPYHIPVNSKIHAINLHPELLPVGRGPWPMPVTIVKGRKQSGVTIHKLSEAYDSGDILLQETYELEENETLITLTQKIQTVSVNLLQRVLSSFDRLYAEAVPQDKLRAEYWAEPSERDRTITLDMSAEETDRRLRAFAGYGCLLQTGQSCVPVDLIQYRRAVPEDKIQVDRIRQMYHNTVSAYTFPCIYCWEEVQDLHIYIEEDWFTVWCSGDDYYYPCGNPDKTALFLKIMMYRKKHFRLGYITKEQKQKLEAVCPELTLTEDRDNYDYIVPMKQIAELEGKHYRTIRKEIHQFERSGVLETEEINADNVHVVQEIAVQWSRQMAGQYDYADTIPEISAIQHFGKLGMFGILAKRDGVYFGFAMGTEISSEMVDVHFAKCIDEDNGADFYCKQMFCRNYMDHYTYMNMEEDMGIEGIRTRKLLFRPTALTELFIAEYNR